MLFLGKLGYLTKCLRNFEANNHHFLTNYHRFQNNPFRSGVIQLYPFRIGFRTIWKYKRHSEINVGISSYFGFCQKIGNDI